MPYDFAFLPDCTFGRLGMRTCGTVFANVQNKHNAPGICTLSGVSLLRLARATGNRQWLDLLADIAGAIPQFMSRRGRPIRDIRPDQAWPEMPDGKRYTRMRYAGKRLCGARCFVVGGGWQAGR